MFSPKVTPFNDLVAAVKERIHHHPEQHLALSRSCTARIAAISLLGGLMIGVETGKPDTPRGKEYVPGRSMVELFDIADITRGRRKIVAEERSATLKRPK